MHWFVDSSNGGTTPGARPARIVASRLPAARTARLLLLLVLVTGCKQSFDAYVPQEAQPAAGPADYRIFINYELGMHCTGFDFSYCCVLPPYNSIQAQVVRVGEPPVLLGQHAADDPAVLVEPDTGRRLRLRYRVVDNAFSEFAKLNYWAPKYDVDGDGNNRETGDTVNNAYWTHLYLYDGLEGANPAATSRDGDKQFVGLGGLQVRRDHGPTGAAMAGDLTSSGATGTVVFTKSPVLDNVPIVLSNPGIWEAIGLPITPFLDSEREGKSFRTLVEEDIQPYQVAEVTLVDADTGEAVRGTDAREVRFTGTEPIDLPACLNCHARPRANGAYPVVAAKVAAERAYWLSIDSSPWVADLKGAAISILGIHDAKHGTDFTANFHPEGSANRLGHDPVLCQKCHADNVVGVLAGGAIIERDGKLLVVDYANVDGGHLPAAGRGAIRAELRPTPDQAAAYRRRLAAARPLPGRIGLTLPPLTEALHRAHQGHSPMVDGNGRSGACQGCHPAHRADRSLSSYPITDDGANPYASGDNRDAAGGCYVGRDVHSNPDKEADGAGTPEHLNAIGRWLQANVSRTGEDKDGDGLGDTVRGLWCTNCHSPVSRLLYQADRLRPGGAFTPAAEETLRDDSLEAIAAGVGLPLPQLLRLLDPRVERDPTTRLDRGATLATWGPLGERAAPDIGVIATANGAPVVTVDGDGDVNVALLDANPGRVASHAERGGVAASYDAASDGRDYWLAAGEPHCADCHKAPFVEGQGGRAFPINQPGKYSLMRYAKGHAGLACQACHQSIHGLYPVTATVDPTTYAQAASLNPDGSHGPLRCGACHQPVNDQGVPVAYAGLTFRDIETDKDHSIGENYDLAVQFIHATADDRGGE